MCVCAVCAGLASGEAEEVKQEQVNFMLVAVCNTGGGVNLAVVVFFACVVDIAC